MNDMLNKLAIYIAPYIAALIIRFLAKTMRITYVNFEKIREDWQKGRNIILAFWHGRLLMMPVMYRGLGVSVMVSQSKDGELIARTIRRFGIDSVRGSSTRGWMGGVKGLLKEVRKGRDMAITPDGPKGPKYEVQPGIIHLAQATGLPIIPMTFGASKKKPLKAGTPSYCHIRFQEACLSALSQS